MAESTALVNKEKSEVTTPETTRSGLYFTPRVDIHETDEELVFSCDVPGVKPDGLDLRFERGELILHGKTAARHRHGEFLLNEYGVGDFYRAFTINEEIQVDQIAADFKHGVLTVRLPKKESAKPKRIAIKAS